MISNSNIGRLSMENQVSKHKGILNKPSCKVPSEHEPDGPIIGNGDVRVVISGNQEKQTYWVSKNDFWRAIEELFLFLVKWIIMKLNLLEYLVKRVENVLLLIHGVILYVFNNSDWSVINFNIKDNKIIWGTKEGGQYLIRNCK